MQEVTTYGNWRKAKNPGLAGLSVRQTVVGGGLALVASIPLLGGNLLGTVALSVLPVGFWALTGVKTAQGISTWYAIRERLAFQMKKKLGENEYRSGPLGKVGAGKNHLPGLLATSELHQFEDVNGRPYAVVRHPATNTFSIVFQTDPPGTHLTDKEQQENWVVSWGQWLNSMAEDSQLESVSVTIENSPDTGEGLRNEIESRLSDTADEFSKAVLMETMATYTVAASVTRAYVAFTYSGKGQGGVSGIADEFAAKVPEMAKDLANTGAGSARAMDAMQLCEYVRIAYDPDAATAIDMANRRGEVAALSWDNVGPSAYSNKWNYLQHDGVCSTTWAMTLAPNGNTPSTILRKLVSPDADLVRKRVTIVYRPLTPEQSSRQAVKDMRLTRSQFLSAKNNSPEAERDYALAEQTAHEQAAGHALVDFGMFVTATYLEASRAKAVETVMKGLAASARIRLRISYGAQDSAFLAALPLGLTASQMMKVSGF